MQQTNKTYSIIIFGIGTIIASTLLGWSSRSSWGLAIIEAIILSVLLLAITRINKDRSRLPVALTIFVFFLILSTVFSVYHYSSILDLVMYILILVAFWLVLQFVRSSKQFKIMIFTLSAVALIAAINGIVNFFQLQDISIGVASFFGWRNIFAGFILLTLPITLTQFLTEKRWPEKSFFGITTVLLAANLYFTFSQASWISVGIVVFLIIWFLRKIPFRQLLGRLSIAVVITIILVIGMLQIHSPAVGETVQEASSIQSNAISNRLDYWKTSFDIFSHYPWMGVGIGNYETIYTHFQQNSWSFSVSPHNSILLFLAELGIFGAIAFLLFLLSIASKAKNIITRKKDEQKYYYTIGLLGGIVASFGHSLVDIDWEIPALLLLWFVEVGLIFAIAKTISKNKVEENQTSNGNSKSQTLVFISALIIGYVIIIPTITDLWNKETDIVQDEMGNVDDSIAQLEKAIALNPLNADLHANLSESYQIRILDHKGVREENQYNIVKYAKRAVELNPYSARNHEVLGYAYNFVSSGEDEEIKKAEQELLTAIKYNPYNTPYQYQLLGFIYQRQKKYDEAISVLDEALSLFNDESISKIHRDQETHDRLVEKMETIKKLRSTILTQMEQ